jgi:hypothetical protein
MKNLPFEYWEQDYETAPGFYQRYWVQRCLELLDADTSHLFSLDSVNSAMILDELVNSPPNRPDSKAEGSNARTFHFLLNELKAQIDSDITLERFAERHLSIPFSSVKRIFHEDKAQSSLLFDDFGNSLKGINAEKLTAIEFAKWLQGHGMAQGANQGYMKQLHELISQNNRESWLNTHHESLLALLDSPGVNEDYLERTTQSWLIELLMYHQYGPIHLSELITSTFLTKSPHDFIARLRFFLEELGRPAQPFTIFMRIQARKEFSRINQIDRVQFATNGQKGIDILNEISSLKKLHPKVKAAAKHFFYQGAPSKHIFAILDVSAKSIGSASRIAIRQLENAINQARFEFERSDFSHDNTMFVFDKSNATFHKFTRRQALADQYIAQGDPIRFESFVNRLNHVRQLSQNEQTTALMTQISTLALQWHRNAVETQQPEIRFMNNWIELEQVFKTATASGLIDGSPSYAACYAVARSLAWDYPWRHVKDIWGDFDRCDVFGPKPYRVRQSGIVRYTNSFQKRIRQGTKPLTDHPRRRNKPIDVEIISQGKDRQKVKGYRIPDGFVRFVEDSQTVKVGQYLAGPDLTLARRPDVLLSVFYDTVPSLLQAAYLILHLPQIFRPDWRNFHAMIDPLMMSAIRSLTDEEILDMEWLARLCHRISKKLERRVTFEELKNDCENLVSHLSNGWGGASIVEIRAQLPDASYKLKQIPAEKWQPLDYLYQFAMNTLADQSVPIAIKFELLRGKSPDFKKFRTLFEKKDLCTNLEKELPDQPLLRRRVFHVHAVIWSIHSGERGFPPPKEVTLKYLWTLDRMRRTRNDLVHSGKVPNNIELLGRQLYCYSKAFINDVIYGLGYLTPNSNIATLKNILHLE